MAQICRASLLEALGKVSPGLASRSFIHQSSCFVFLRGWVCTFNDEVCCRTRSGLDPGFTAAVPAKPLMSVLETFSAAEVDVTSSGREFRVRAGRDKAGVRIEPDVTLPVDRVSPPPVWTPLPAEFADAVRIVSASAGTRKEEFITTCVHVHPEWVEATDRQQVTRYTLSTGVSRPFLVRAKSLAHVADCGFTRFGETEEWVHFSNRSVILSARKAGDTFPDLSAFLTRRAAPVQLPGGTQRAAKLGAVFSRERTDAADDKLDVSISPAGMAVRGKGDRGWSEVLLDMPYDGPDVFFRISPAALIDLVDRYTSCEIGPGMLIVRGEGWVYYTVLGTGTPAAPSRPVDSVGGSAADDVDGAPVEEVYDSYDAPVPY